MASRPLFGYAPGQLWRMWMIVGLRLLLAFLLLAFLAGRYVPGPSAWGFNHLAYLPWWITPLWVLAAAAILVPAVQRKGAQLLESRCSGIIWERRWSALVLPVMAGIMFALFRERSFFMGDGYLIGELADRGVMFRAFDSLDYLLHFQALLGLKRLGVEVSAFTVYRVASVLAGTGAVAVFMALLRRMPWEPWRRSACLGLLFFMGPAAMYFGYVESYTFLLVFLTAFMLAGLGVLEGRYPLWAASGFFGLGLAFHMTAVFSAPALLVLLLRAPGLSASRRWIQTLFPPFILFVLAVILHLAEGYNTAWFRKEFVDNQNVHSIFLPFSADRGLLSSYHWKDLANLALITAPACMAVVLIQAKAIARSLADSRVLFLGLQIGSTLLFSLLVDRKLGGARDWDLLAAHSAGLVLLAALFLPPIRSRSEGEGEPGKKARTRSGRVRPSPALTRPHPAVCLVLATALLLTAPWVLLLHLEERSIDRFVSVAADFPPFARAYAYEEVGKYYRKAAEADPQGPKVRYLMARAEEMYELCVEAYPGNMRFRILLGSVYYGQGKLSKAEQEYLHVVGRDSTSFMATEMLGRVYVQQERFDESIHLFRRLTRLRPGQHASWELLGLAAMRADSTLDVLTGLTRAMELNPALEYDHEVGVANLRLGRNLEAADAFLRAIQRGQNSIPTRIGLGWSLVLAFEAGQRTGAPVDPQWLEIAAEHLESVLREAPEDEEAAGLLGRVRHPGVSFEGGGAR